MADQEALKSKLKRIKQLAENCIDDCNSGGGCKEYEGDAQFLYSVASGFIQKMALDDEDRKKEEEQ